MTTPKGTWVNVELTSWRVIIALIWGLTVILIPLIIAAFLLGTVDSPADRVAGLISVGTWGMITGGWNTALKEVRQTAGPRTTFTVYRDINSPGGTLT